LYNFVAILYVDVQFKQGAASRKKEKINKTNSAKKPLSPFQRPSNIHQHQTTKNLSKFLESSFH